MSPEQARGDTVDERTDIWSLGVVLYEMVAGSSPFVAGTSNEIISAILSKQPAPPLTRYSRLVPERLEEIIEKALAKNRDERYQTSKDLFIDLKRLKQSLELKASIERSTSQRNQIARTSSAQLSESDSFPFADGTPSFRSTSSIEYVINHVKLNINVFAVILFVLVLAIVTTALVYNWRVQKSAITHPVINSLSVLPLKSFEPGENYLGIGITDAVIRRMSQTGKLIVRPTSAVRRYLKEDTDGLTAAKQSGVDSVLEGTVQRENDRLRVSVNLLRATTARQFGPTALTWTSATHFTSSRFDFSASRRPSPTQTRSSATQAQLAKRYTSNSEAYDYYVKRADKS